MREAAVLAALALLGGCDLLPGEWKGWVYPNRSNLIDDIPIGAFKTLEECRAAALNVLRRVQSRDETGELIQGDYECGYKCEAESMPGGLNVCERTER